MNTRKTSLFKTVLEYLGRGAAPVDGIYWVGNTSAPAGSNERRSDNHLNAAVSACSPRLDKCAPAAPGS